MTTIARTDAPVDFRIRYSYFGVMAGVFAVTTIVGFARTYYFKSFTGAPELTATVAWHGLVFTLWPILLVAQTWLVAKERVRAHRALGVAGAVLAAAMIVVGMLASIEAARLGHRGRPPVEMPDAEIFLAIPVRDLLLFGSLFGAALWYRRSPEAHKRLVLLATLGGLLPAPIGRLQSLGPAMVIPAGLFAFGLIFSGPLYDWRRHRRVHAAYSVGVPFVLLTYALTRPIAFSGWWHAFAEWLVR